MDDGQGRSGNDGVRSSVTDLPRFHSSLQNTCALCSLFSVCILQDTTLRSAVCLYGLQFLLLLLCMMVFFHRLLKLQFVFLPLLKHVSQFLNLVL